MLNNFKAYLSLFTTRRINVMLFLGFASGLPLSLTSKTLQAQFTEAGISVEAIGFLTLVSMPYAWKFLWAPLLDRYTPPLFGRRRGWMLITQIVLLISIATMGFINPKVMPLWLGGLAFFVAFVSATQDISFNGFMVDTLESKERGMGAALQTWGYRAAMLVSGGGALIIADFYSWRVSYLCMALCMIIGIVATLFSPNPKVEIKPKSLRSAVVEPFLEFMSRPSAIAFLGLVIIYKLGDAFSGSLTYTFLLRGLGFSLTDVGGTYKIAGTIATIAGVFFGGALLVKLRLFRSLFVFGILQAVSIISFMILALLGKNYIVMIGAVVIENIAWGMATAAFLALLMALCDTRFSATQFALLSALDSIGRIYVGPVAGFLQIYSGWAWFFLISTVAALPGLALLWVLRNKIHALDNGKLSV